MEKENNNMNGIRERLKDHSITPSDRVWQGIEAAAPAPVTPSGIIRPFIYGAAALLFVAGVFLLYRYTTITQDDQMEQVELLVPAVPSEEEHAAQPTKEAPVASDDHTDEPSNGHLQPQHTADATTDEVPGTEGVRVAAETHQPKPSRQPSSQETRTGTTTIGAADPPSEGVPERVPRQPVDETPPVTPPPIQDTPSDPPVTDDPETPEPPAEEDLVQWEVPNAFMANYDGVNDYFKPVILNNADITDFRMQIYTREGVLLFESTHLDNGWDGTYNGMPVQPQVYIWAISFRDIEGKSYARRGHVTLLR